MPRVLVAIRFPEDLKRFIDEESAKRGITTTSFIVNACWRDLEEPTSNTQRAVNAFPVDKEEIAATFDRLAGKSTKQSLLSTIPGLKVAAKLDEPAVVPLTQHESAPEQQSMCTYQEYDQESGETMACGLRAHSGKVKHGAWHRVS